MWTLATHRKKTNTCVERQTRRMTQRAVIAVTGVMMLLREGAVLFLALQTAEEQIESRPWFYHNQAKPLLLVPLTLPL